MDPVTLTTSIVTLIGAADAVILSLRKLASLRHMSATICVLNNEVSDLRLLLQEVDSLLLERGKLNGHGTKICRQPDPGLQSLVACLKPAKENLLALESLITDRFLRVDKSLDRVSFLRLENKAIRLQNDIHYSRISIGAAVAVLTSTSTLRLQMQLDTFQLMTKQSQNLTLQSIGRQQDIIHSAMAPLTILQEQSAKSLERVEGYLRAITGAEEPSLPQYYQDLPKETSSEIQRRFPQSTSSTVRVAVRQRRKCEVWCNCSCHRIGHFKTPKVFKAMLGVAYAGFSGIPALNSPCSSRTCKGSLEGLLQVNYHFPSWFLARALAVAIHLTQSGPELHLRTLRVRPPTSKVFTLAYLDDGETFKQLLTSGQASVLDVDSESGHSALHVALAKGRTNVAQLLLQFGADAHLENHYHETPYEMAWSSILCFRGTTNASRYKVDELVDLFPSPDLCEEHRRFTKLHKAVLGLLHFDLEQELKLDPSAVDQVDADGRTPLTWACARGDHDLVAVLLRYGADPNKVDRIGQGPLRASIKADHPLCMRLLLEAGAEVDIRDKWQQTCLIATNYYQNAEHFIPILLAHGANVNAKEHVGASPLSEAVRCGKGENVAAVKLLLDHGGDIDSQDNSGHTPLHYAVRCNAHKLIPLLMAARPNVTLRNKAQQTILHLAALEANMTTLQVLSGYKLRGLDVNGTCSDGKPARMLAQERLQASGKISASEKESATPTVDELSYALEDLFMTVKISSSARSPQLGDDSPDYSAENSDAEESLAESWHSALDDLALIGIGM